MSALASLDRLDPARFVRKQKIGRSNYCINVALNAVLQSQSAQAQPPPAAP